MFDTGSQPSVVYLKIVMFKMEPTNCIEEIELLYKLTHVGKLRKIALKE